MTRKNSLVTLIIARTVFQMMNNRRLRAGQVDYIRFTLDGDIPVLPQPRSWLQERLLGRSPLSLMELSAAFDRIARDPRPRGVVLNLRSLMLPYAHIQTLRDSLLRLRESGKRVVVCAMDYDTRSYYLASAADEILIQPGGTLLTLGIYGQQVYLADGLGSAGLEFDSVVISPYKGGADALTRSEPSAESEAQINWLYDSLYDTLIDGIAQARNLTPAAVRDFFDSAPHLDHEALEAGFVDARAHEVQLAEHLGVEHLLDWDDADKLILQRWRGGQSRHVALLSLTGAIMPGESAKPPVKPPAPVPFVGGERLGDRTVLEQIQKLRDDPHIAAVILYIDSPGGSAAASEAITAALEELAQDRPLVACFGSVAASGGYYIATPAQWIVAQPAAVTGSIGVLVVKPAIDGLLRRFRLNPVAYQRGQNADILAPANRFSDAQRDRMLALIRSFYDQFVDRVAQSRRLSTEAVDAVGGGRVWTGAQALENGLVDELGGLHEAAVKARELAGLPLDAPVMLMRDKRPSLVAQLMNRASPAAWLRYAYDNAHHIASGTAQMLLPFDLRD